MRSGAVALREGRPGLAARGEDEMWGAEIFSCCCDNARIAWAATGWQAALTRRGL